MAKPQTITDKAPKKAVDFKSLLTTTLAAQEASKKTSDSVTEEEAMEMLAQGKKCLVELDEPQTIRTSMRKTYALGTIDIWGHSLTIETKSYDEESEEAIPEAGTFKVDLVSASIWNGTIRLTAWV
jgi:hypothetical protein